MIKNKCKVTYICHGATIYTETDRLCDKNDYPPLNETGKEEIENISKWMKKRGIMIDKIYCSPELRVIQSAQILSKICKQDYTVIPELYARRVGTWSGLSYEQIEKKYPKELDAYHKNRADFIMPEGESLIQFNKRTDKIIQNLVGDNDSSRIVVITHRGVIQSAIAKVLDVPAENQTRITIPTGSASQISYYKDWSILVYSGIISY